MTLRKQKRVGRDAIIRAEKLLDDLRLVEKLLRRMRTRDEKKEHMLEVRMTVERITKDAISPGERGSCAEFARLRDFSCARVCVVWPNADPQFDVRTRTL